MKPEDIGNLRPDDRFHIHGLRLIVDRQDWPRGLQWLQRLIERYRPPIPRGSWVTLKVNGNIVLQVPLDLPFAPGQERDQIGPSPSAAFARDVLVLSPTDQFECGVQFPKAVRLSHAAPVRIMLDGYLVRGHHRIPETIYGASSPERT